MLQLAKRIYYIDFLKTLGLALIMLAHISGTPAIVQMIRGFDVPLMVFISGFLAYGSFQRRYPDGKCGVRYFWDRFKRLVFPTWIFLAFYFSLLAATGRTESFPYYLASFGLTRHGVGYVWIILIYLLCALLIPFICRISKSKTWLIVALALYALDEILYYFGVGNECVVVQDTLYYIIPYGFVTALGYNYQTMSKRLKIGIAAISCLAFAICGVYYFKETGSIVGVRTAKYPPRLYYMSWGIFVSMALMALCENIDIHFYKNTCFQFVSKHSLWIYLWHILYVTVLNHTPISAFWWIEFPLVFAISCGTVWLQNYAVSKIEAKTSWNGLSYFKY